MALNEVMNTQNIVRPEALMAAKTRKIFLDHQLSGG
jgi:hypothetical protein